MSEIKIQSKAVRRDPYQDSEALLDAFDALVDSLDAGVQLTPEVSERLSKMREDKAKRSGTG